MKLYGTTLHPSVWLHFGAGILISVLFFLMPYYEFKLGWLLSTLISLVAGVFFASWKEYEDWKLRKELVWKKWDWIDWIFTVKGSLVIPVIFGIVLLLI